MPQATPAHPFARFYTRLVFGRPLLVLAVALLACVVFGYYAQYFRLDASADSLLLENDPDLEFSREVNRRYGVRESVIVAYTPQRELFSRGALQHLTFLRDELLTIDRVESVDSILNVPVFGDTPLTGISEDYLTVLAPGQDLAAAREELVNSPVFRNALVSPDGQTAGLLVSFAVDQIARELLIRRSALRRLEVARELLPPQVDELAAVEAEYAAHSVLAADRQHEIISSIRGTLDSYRDEATIYLGGAPMIADDLVTFVRGDLSSFSIAVLALVIVALGLIFRRLRFVAMPLLCCAVAGTIMVGILGFMDWRVTVVSSNFISLLLIITISLTVHLTVRYRELRATRHHSSHDKLLRHAVLSMFRPCLYTALTTAVAFGSLVVSGILPIITFGWMMMMGVATALLVAFTLFPAVMSLLTRDTGTVPAGLRLNLTGALARFTDVMKGRVIVLYVLIALLSVMGLNRLRVENSFIDYFRQGTEIYQGMVLLDEKLGGTLSFDVIVDLPQLEADFADDFQDDFITDSTDSVDDAGDDSAVNDDFNVNDAATTDDAGNWFQRTFAWVRDQLSFDTSVIPPLFGRTLVSDDAAYWFTPAKMNQIEAIHDYLDADPYTGKVLSFGGVIKLAEQLNDNEPIDALLWALLYSRIPESLRETVLFPYVSIDANQTRFNVRVIESAPDLNRNELLQRIETGLETEFGFNDEQVRLTGILVMYNNVLQSLFQSQILTLGVVMFAIMLMFLFLFRSLAIAVLCIIPNAIAAAFVLGVMGWLNIPLDIMTITIAAISVGIGVDNTIHYMHRFRREFSRLGNYRDTMFFCHNSIGRAMYFTSMTIVAGFSILALSNFIPTVVFGLLTSLAMLVALVGSLTLLPRLLITFKPLGEEH
ncbi:MAG: efflux RND transporter permease subunit [Pseudohongiellaceae bacterium]